MPLLKRTCCLGANGFPDCGPFTLQVSEKKRLDLEKKLYEYSQSDICRVKLKYVKLKKYLKEICESEKRAHTRNKEYLKQLECIQAHVGHFTTNTEKLQELKERLSPENRTTDLKCDSSSPSEGSEGEILTQEYTEVKEERARLPVSPISVLEYCASGNKCSQEKHSAGEGFSDHCPHGDPESQKPFRKVQEEQEEESLRSSSDLTGSVSEDDLILKSPEPQRNPDDMMEGEDGIEALKLIHSEQERDAPSTEKHNFIMQTLISPDSKKESSTNSPTRELYNHSDILKEDLEDCRPAVLHQLLRLSPGGGTDEKQVRSEQACALSLLRAQLGQHVSTLKEHDNSAKEEIGKLSEVFLVKNVDQGTKAPLLLKRVPTEECEGRSAFHSNESSCSLPSILNDNTGIKEARPALWFNRVLTREQEVPSGCRDESKEESMVVKIPIMGLNIGSGTLKIKTTNKIISEASFSSSEGSPLSRHENKKKLTTNLKSKAFCIESDDSNSEIEAALRPRNHSTSTDDFDDFYD
ncbi:kizuna centrosomal protein [Phyllostomus discolor]|uniref:Centrosomal protein kizuna n=1 Tax=Phyllostomus discolor TaxID=89673 RepID=A0A833ZAR4_9CHIR|nr:kizuna centrosomal protein [Phyllostomus discolor]